MAEEKPTAPVEAPAVEVTSPAPAAAKSEFAQIRGISEKRAEQLKAIGINTYPRPS